MPTQDPLNGGGRRRRQPSAGMSTKNRQQTASGDPLTWWRSVPLAKLNSRHTANLSRALRNIEMPSNGRWRDARSGDAAAALACAVPMLAAGIAEAPLDVAMTAVLLCAVQGNPAARMVLVHASRKLGAGSNPRTETARRRR